MHDCESDNDCIHVVDVIPRSDFNVNLSWDVGSIRLPIRLDVLNANKCILIHIQVWLTQSELFVSAFKDMQTCSTVCCVDAALYVVSIRI